MEVNENSKKTDQHAQLALCRAGKPPLIYFVVGIFERRSSGPVWDINQLQTVAQELSETSRTAGRAKCTYHTETHRIYPRDNAPPTRREPVILAVKLNRIISGQSGLRCILN